ncbi:MAG TPA: EAL domain-containing protein [Gammaproteobacteria bacterium]|nr:EAL domain-containing protein [Gammaproteobacteria bacterium]
MATPLRVLLVEDTLADAELLLMELKRGGYEVSYERYTTEAEVRLALKVGTWDLIVSDYSLPGFDGMRCLQLYRESGLDIPFLLMSGTVGEEIAVEAMKGGAHDYIMKDRLVRLVPAIKRELREAEARRERRSFMEQMEFIAYHDPVTRLPNQRLFLQEVEQAIRKSSPGDGQLVIAIPEIAKFKEIRTTVTQADYDTLMRQIADRIWLRCEGMLTLSRVDDYTFAALFPADKEADPAAVARSLLTAFDEPYEIDPFLLHLDASVGMAVHSPETPAAGMLRNAMVAANQAQEKHQPYALYSMAEDLSSPGNLALLGQLRDAIRGGELELHYQPILELGTGRITEVEALVRWNHPELGLLQPEKFLGLAESSNLIIPLTAWVVDAAFSQWRQWHESGLDVDMAINLSVRNIQDRAFAGYIAQRAKEHGIDPGRFVLEVTESSIMTDHEVANDELMRLREFGFKVAVDDFGTGHSSLSYLQRLPVDDIKVDRNFVTRIGENPQDLAIVNAVLGFAKGLGKRVVAEGVESGEALGILRDIGCHLAQGYHISRPLGREAAAQWLAKQKLGR